MGHLEGAGLKIAASAAASSAHSNAFLSNLPGSFFTWGFRFRIVPLTEPSVYHPASKLPIMDQKPGKLFRVPLREIWKNEEYDFSAWLAEPDRISPQLGDQIGIAITLPQKEAIVGKYSTDILAEEEDTGRKIVIENQLERTNHDHLGKVITYAAGHHASIVIWIFKEITEDHRNAIDWLNKNTDEDRLFFAVQIEARPIRTTPNPHQSSK